MRIMDLAKTGATDEEIATAVGVSSVTLRNWKGQFSNFEEALRETKSIADELVEASLYSRACGYTTPAIKLFFDTKRGTVHMEKYTEHHAPDTTACIFWLKNRQPANWRDAHKELQEKNTEFDSREESAWKFKKTD